MIIQYLPDITANSVLTMMNSPLMVRPPLASNPMAALLASQNKLHVGATPAVNPQMLAMMQQMARKKAMASAPAPEPTNQHAPNHDECAATVHIRQQN